jgi:uncharacterized membrane protein
MDNPRSHLSLARLGGIAGIAFAVVLLAPLGARAATGVAASTPYPGVIVEPGKTANFSLALTGDLDQDVPLGTAGLPDGWLAEYKGGGAVVDRAHVSTDPTSINSVTLEVTPPVDAEDGPHEFMAMVGDTRVPLDVTVKAGVGGSVTLSSDFPGLRGPNDTDFTFNISVSNRSEAVADLELKGTGPDGWTVTAEPTSQSKAAAISIDPGQSTTVKLTAAPPANADAGVYDVGLTVTGAGIDESITVNVELVGEVSMSLTTPDQRLNAEIGAGGPTGVPILVINDGTADLTNVSVSATAPTDWNVTFEPDGIADLAPGDSTVITAQVTTSDNVIAGDYDITFSAAADAASDSMDVRTTVTPSVVGGIVGVGLIALTLAGLSLVFRHYGRR